MNQEVKTTVIVCEPNVDIGDAGELQKRLLAVIGENAKVALDAREVAKIDTAALQLFYSLVKKLKNSGIEYSWIGASDVFVNSAELLGLKEALGLAEAL